MRRIDRRVIKIKRLNFRFENLQPHTCYTLCIEIDGHDPSFCHFRTLMNGRTKSSSMMVMGVHTRDYFFPSHRISKLASFLDKTASSLTMYLIHSNTSTSRVASSIHANIPTLSSKGDMQELYRRGHVIHIQTDECVRAERER